MLTARIVDETDFFRLNGQRLHDPFSMGVTLSYFKDMPYDAVQVFRGGALTTGPGDFPHCRCPLIHGPAEGHREAHCDDLTSPFYRSGGNLALVQTADG